MANNSSFQESNVFSQVQDGNKNYIVVDQVKIKPEFISSPGGAPAVVFTWLRRRDNRRGVVAAYKSMVLQRTRQKMHFREEIYLEHDQLQNKSSWCEQLCVIIIQPQLFSTTHNSLLPSLLSLTKIFIPLSYAFRTTTFQHYSQRKLSEIKFRWLRITQLLQRVFKLQNPFKETIVSFKQCLNDLIFVLNNFSFA